MDLPTDRFKQQFGTHLKRIDEEEPTICAFEYSELDSTNRMIPD